MPIIWVCVICNAEQKDQELKCWRCGNILDTDFREKDVGDELNNKEKNSESTIPAPKEEVKTMVDETPHVEKKEEIGVHDTSEPENVVIKEKPKKKRRKKKKG